MTATACECSTLSGGSSVRGIYRKELRRVEILESVVKWWVLLTLLSISGHLARILNVTAFCTTGLPFWKMQIFFGKHLHCTERTTQANIWHFSSALAGLSRDITENCNFARTRRRKNRKSGQAPSSKASRRWALVELIAYEALSY